MKNLFRALATLMLFAGLSTAAYSAAPGTGAGFSHATSTAAAETPGLYAVAQKLFAESKALVADVSVQSAGAVQLLTVTATGGTCRVVLSDADGQILRSRAVEGELDVDFYDMPTGTYHLAILDASGALAVQHTLVKR